MAKKKKYYINPFIYMKFEDEQLLLVDYKAHNYYEIPIEYLKRMRELQEHADGVAPNKLDADLVKFGIISTKPYEPFEWKWTSSSHIFHYGTRDYDYPNWTSKEFAQSLQEGSDLLMAKEWPSVMPPRCKDLPVVPLPPVDEKKLFKASLWDALYKRKTSRSFFKKKMALEKLAAVLKVTFGAYDHNFDEISPKTPEFISRTSPSGGCIHSIMPYVIALRVEGITPGVYFYDFVHHNLKLIKKVNLTKDFGYIMGSQNWANDLSAGIVMTSRFDREWVKYQNSRAYRVILLDTGHLSQTLLLCATALGLQTWLSGAFRDTLMEETLGIDSPSEAALFVVGLGIGDGSIFDKETIRAKAKK